VLGLADFLHPDGDDPLDPGPAFQQFRTDFKDVFDLFTPTLTRPASRATGMMFEGKQIEVVNFACYNYLGLARHPAVLAAAHKALDDYGIGNCGPPLLSGMSQAHVDLEHEICDWLSRDASMLFASGFSAGTGLVAGLVRRGDVVIFDSLCHMSTREGARASGARTELFDHNDPKSLDELLERHKDKRRLVVVEGIYSMEGDFGDLPRLLPVCDAHGVRLVIDEAHSILAWGREGRGIGDHFGMHDKVGLQFGTMSKTFGSVGGFLAGDDATIAYLRLFASSYVFSAALPPVVAAAACAALKVGRADESLRARMRDNAEYLRKGLTTLGIDIGASVTQIVPIMMGADRQALYELAREIRRRGVFVNPADYPSVPEDGLRYRLFVTAEHTREDLDRALNVFEDTVARRQKR
jgi:glycine C-acetyltransferase